MAFHRKVKQCITALALLASVSCLASYFPDKYDKHFKDAVIFLPLGTDWRLLKSQGWQESRLNPFAVSPVGARGVMQFMPATWKDMKVRYRYLENPWLPEHSILAGALYMKQMHDYWKTERPDKDRYNLSLASYNAGAGNLTKAQKLCNMSVYYDDIITCLPNVTGHHSKETINYVRLITKKWYPMMLYD